MAKKYFGPNSAEALIELVKEDLGKKVNTGDIVNALNSTETNKPLSAAQGKALAEQIAGKGTGDMSKSVYDKDGDGVVDKAKAADTATKATSADSAEEATHAASADTATRATNATNAEHATSADNATNATNATEAEHAEEADHATTADSATKATSADTATKATNADTAKTADSATKATNADHATSADSATTAASAASADNAAKLEGHAASYFEVSGAGKTYVDGLKGKQNGLAPLDASGMIDAQYLPSYVDDVVEGYLNGGKFYKEAAHSTVITGESGKIYVDLHTGGCWRYSGSTYVEIVSSDMVELKDSEIQSMWNG